MRSAGVLIDFCLQVLFLSKYSNSEAPQGAATCSKGGRLRQRSKRPRRPDRAALSHTPGMVLSAIVQFLKRVCILVIGLFRLTYRKVTIMGAMGSVQKARSSSLCSRLVGRTVVLINEHHDKQLACAIACHQIRVYMYLVTVDTILVWSIVNGGCMN